MRLEQQRARLQAALDDSKTRQERNALGQFATPGPLALEIVRAARQMHGADGKMAFMDPAFGTGAFYSALRRVFPPGVVEVARGYEIDAHYGAPAQELWGPAGLDLEIGDFTTAKPPADGQELADLLICNPPYVRHHHISPTAKGRLASEVEKDLGIRVSGLAGLYVYFMLLSHKWLKAGSLSVWLVPSEFMDVNYGSALKNYLLDHVDLLRIHRFDPSQVQFGDALVSSAVVLFRRRPPSSGSDPKFTFGGSIATPRAQSRVGRTELCHARKWTRFPVVAGSDGVADRSGTQRTGPRATLGDFFSIRRGVVTGANHFFVLDEARAAALPIPPRFLTPILPSPRRLRADIVNSDAAGRPKLDERRFLFDCRMPRADLAQRAPEAAAYVATGEATGIHEGYLALRRDPWYAQEHRDPAPFLCTYMGRSACGKPPFRVILNRSRAIATNVYLMLYPKGGLPRMMHDSSAQAAVWDSLRRIVDAAWRSGGRVYGGGLHKVEPRELARFPADALVEALPALRHAAASQLALL